MRVGKYKLPRHKQIGKCIFVYLYEPFIYSLVCDLSKPCLFLHTPTSANRLPEATVFCEAETTEFLSWPETLAGTTVSIQCPSSTIIINRTCSSSGVWESVDPSLCIVFSSINIVSVSEQLDIDSQWHSHFSSMHA